MHETLTAFEKLVEAIKASSATADEKIAIFDALSNYIANQY
jgi:hypothetical protein